MGDNWLTWAILSAAFAAATAVLSKVGLRGVDDPDLGQFVRTAVVLVVVAALIARNGAWRQLGTVNARSWTFLVLAGVATAASWVCYFRALAVGEASRVAAVDKLSVIMVACVAALFLGERLSALGWLGVGLAAAGVALVSVAK